MTVFLEIWYVGIKRRGQFIKFDMFSNLLIVFELFIENRKLGGHLGFCPKTERSTPNSVENFLELKKYVITISKMYGLLWIKFIPPSRLVLLHYTGNKP